MSWNGMNGMKLSGGLGNTVFQPKTKIYGADGTGRDVHCFTHARNLDSFQPEAPKFVTDLRDNNGRKKSPNLAHA